MFAKSKSAGEDWRLQPLKRSAVTQPAAMLHPSQTMSSIGSETIVVGKILQRSLEYLRSHRGRSDCLKCLHRRKWTLPFLTRSWCRRVSRCPQTVSVLPAPESATPKTDAASLQEQVPQMMQGLAAPQMVEQSAAGQAQTATRRPSCKPPTWKFLRKSQCPGRGPPPPPHASPRRCCRSQCGL